MVIFLQLCSLYEGKQIYFPNDVHSNVVINYVLDR